MASIMQTSAFSPVVHAPVFLGSALVEGLCDCRNVKFTELTTATTPALFFTVGVFMLSYIENLFPDNDEGI